MPPAKKTPQPRRRDLVQEALLVAALAFEALLLVALLVHGPDAEGGRGVVGIVGRFAASALYLGFGVVSFLVLALAMFTTVLAIVRRPVSTPVLRVVGAALMLLGACALVHQLLPHGYQAADGAHPLGRDPGGWVGETVYSLLRVPFGVFGASVFSVVLLCTGFAFATDWLLYEMFYDGLKRLAGTTSLLARFWPKPALATTAAKSAATKSAAPPPPKDEFTSTPEAAVAVVDADVETETDAAVLDDPEVIVPAELVPPPLPMEDDEPEPAMPVLKVKLD